MRTVSKEESVPLAGYCATTRPSPSPPLAGRVITSAVKRHALEPSLGVLQSLAPDDRRHVDLVRLARGLLRGLGAGDVRDQVHVVAVAVVEQPLLVAVDDLARNGRLVRGRGERLGRLLLVGERLLREALPDERRVGAAGDGLPSNSVSIGTSLFGYPTQTATASCGV